MSFLTFSLPILSMPLGEKERLLDAALTDAIYRAGKASENEIGYAKIRKYVSDHPGIGFTSGGTHETLVRGALLLNVTLGSCKRTADEFYAARNYVAEHEQKHGASPLVFISTELFWQYIHETGIDYRSLSTLCAINSVVGFRKIPVLIRREMIIARQLGYKTPAVMRAELPNRAEQKPLTVQQLRDTLDELEGRGLFSRVQASRRCVYFSTTILNADDLRKVVKGMVEKKQEVANRRIADREAFGKNHNGTTREPQKNHLKRNRQNEAEKNHLKREEPLGNQNGTMTGTTGGTTKRNVLKKCSETNEETCGERHPPSADEQRKREAAEFKAAALAQINERK